MSLVTWDVSFPQPLAVSVGQIDWSTHCSATSAEGHCPASHLCVFPAKHSHELVCLVGTSFPFLSSHHSLCPFSQPLKLSQDSGMAKASWAILPLDLLKSSFLFLPCARCLYRKIGLLSPAVSQAGFQPCGSREFLLMCFPEPRAEDKASLFSWCHLECLPTSLAFPTPLPFQ